MGEGGGGAGVGRRGWRAFGDRELRAYWIEGAKSTPAMVYGFGK